MLVLQRKRGEAICVGDDIKVIVTFIGEGKVKIGIDAPRDVRILREEIADEVRKESP